MPFPDALKIVTSNVAKVLGIEKRKGSLAEGMDADLILLDKDYKIETVLAQGQVVVEEGMAKVKRYFELG